MRTGTVISVRTGRIIEKARPAWDHAASRTMKSAFGKHEVAGSVAVATLGLVGDEQKDHRHGGPEMAVLMYADAHYAGWRLRPGLEAMGPGGFGENLTVDGFDETTVCIGDVLDLGELQLEVSSPRAPCAQISRHWNAEWLLKDVAASRRTGWYLRVRRPGAVARGQSIRLVERKHEGWTVDRLLRLRLESPRDPGDLAALTKLEALSDEWKAMYGRLAAKA